MIAIVNCTSPPTETGINTYKLCINRKEPLEFEHRREESLSICLRKAADAYDMKYGDMKKIDLSDPKQYEEAMDAVLSVLFKKQ